MFRLPSDTPWICTSVLLGELAASKTASRGSTPRARADWPTWLDRSRHRFCKPADAGANPVVGSACPDGVAERIGPSEGPGPGSNPGRDTDSRSLRVCRIARQSSKLQDEVQLLGGLLRDLRPRGVLDGHATLRRLRSRFDSWRGRLRRWSQTVRRLPAKQLSSGFDSHRRL